MKKQYTTSELKETPMIEVFNKAGIVFCPTCREGFNDKVEKEFIKKTGMCASCDHSLGEAMEEQKRADCQKYQQNPEEEAMNANPNWW